MTYVTPSSPTADSIIGAAVEYRLALIDGGARYVEERREWDDSVIALADAAELLVESGTATASSGDVEAVIAELLRFRALHDARRVGMEEAKRDERFGHVAVASETNR